MAHSITDQNKEIVCQLAGFGVPQADIARTLKISVDTLARRYRSQLAEGVAQANLGVAKRLYAIAMSDSKEALTACIFWMKCRGGWRQSPEVEVNVGVTQQVGTSLTPVRSKSELVEFAARWERLKLEDAPGKSP
jgi:hypothetical protein